MRKLVVLVFSLVLINFVSAGTTFFEGDLGYRDDFVMGTIYEEIVESESVELLEDPFVEESSGGSSYFERQEEIVILG